MDSPRAIHKSIAEANQKNLGHLLPQILFFPAFGALLVKIYKHTLKIVFFRSKALSNHARELGEKRALLVGINHYYLDDAIGNLKYCVNDVVELNRILSDSLRGNFTTQPLHSDIEDKKLTPTRSNIMSMLKLLSSNSEQNDTVLFYFAGHGFEQDGVNYLLPADARLNVLSETAIALRWVKKTLSESLAKKKFIIIDACHAGSRLGRSLSIPMTKSFEEEMFSESEGLAILSSCRFGQVSYDFPEKNHGAFSYFLLEGLQGSADVDSDHIVTVPDVNKYVSTEMHKWCLKMQLEQNPTFVYNVSGDFLFVRVPYEGKEQVLEPAITGEPSEIVEKDEGEAIRSVLEDISFLSDDDVYSDNILFDQLKNMIVHEDKPEKKTGKSKLFLKQFIATRFSSSLAQDRLMNIVEIITELREIKKWIRNEPVIKQFLILEFLTSNNFDYAGTMAHIINNLIPIFSDDELTEIINGIEKNDQITSSFKARRYLISIIDSCKTILPLEKYKQLKSTFL